ncbi:hypothetical protein AK812_SmicGene5646 [Symbiodinium microadriaticum]|uniref:Uncharacterized protein n=1 Tax=Symbiodinium microadriaticum TaxID=2951 RepID=A0A1Q9ET34_SYMMI|nr:hypothetical protein AK812_SmicGene5646 [Symbiodinium microadriaticum]
MDRMDHAERAPARNWRVDMLVEEVGKISSLDRASRTVSLIAAASGQEQEQEQEEEQELEQEDQEEQGGPAPAPWKRAKLRGWVIIGDLEGGNITKVPGPSPSQVQPAAAVAVAAAAAAAAETAVQVFRGMLVILYTAAQVIRAMSSVDNRISNHGSLAICNIASFLCYPGLMLACGYSSA